MCVLRMLLLDRVKMAAGSISGDEFNDLAMKLAEFSTNCNDTWTIKNSPRDSSEKYLEKIMMVKGSTTTRLASENASKDDCNVCLEDDMTVEDPDPSCVHAVETPHDTFLSCQFHVVYSHSYSVPVLYFNICRTDGKRLSLEELWNRVPVEYQHRIENHKWATLTQQEHPYLGSPFFMLHPCHTASLMSQVPGAEDKRYYLIKWLSSVAPVVGLELSPAYATAFDPTDNT